MRNITRREYFAGIALGELMKTSLSDNNAQDILDECKSNGVKINDYLAEGAVAFADALIKKLDLDS